MNQHAGTHYPRIPEFDNVILEPLYRKSCQHVAIPNAQAMLMSQIGITREVHYLFGAGNPWEVQRSKRHAEYEDTPSSSPVKRRRKEPENVPSSPLSTDGSDDDINLDKFEAWCRGSYKPEYNWSEVFDILRDADIGLDFFSSKKPMKASKLLKLCSTTDQTLKGTAAERICKAHARWIKKGKPSS